MGMRMNFSMLPVEKHMLQQCQSKFPSNAPIKTPVMQSAIRLAPLYRGGHLIIGRGESGSEIGVPGKFSEGDPDLEHSNECECDSGGVCPIYYQR